MRIDADSVLCILFGARIGAYKFRIEIQQKGGIFRKFEI
jgi:hypothetical protein